MRPHNDHFNKQFRQAPKDTRVLNRQKEHDNIADQIAEFEAKGGVIEDLGTFGCEDPKARISDNINFF